MTCKGWSVAQFTVVLPVVYLSGEGAVSEPRASRTAYLVELVGGDGVGENVPSEHAERESSHDTYETSSDLSSAALGSHS